MTPATRGAYECRSSLLTAGAKAAVLSGSVALTRAALLQPIEPLESGAATARDLARIGTALARALLPATVREGLETMRTRPLVIVHDREASRVPWEVLRIGTTHPALGGGLSRRYASDTLSVARWRDDRDASDPLRVLLIVDPTRDLPGAAVEGEALQQSLGRRSVSLDVLAGRDATRARILAALGSGAFDVLHFAGHAFFDAREPGRGGLLCDGKEVLRGADLASIGNLPALVFCNACEAARVRRPASRGASPARLFGMRRTMTGIAEAFLAGGVANFLGTHWPVGDDAALAFSQSLYESLLTGDRLGDAVLTARRRLESIDTVDWADYVHYGSPEFRLAGFP
jgi:CHAT domain-containing protein